MILNFYKNRLKYLIRLDDACPTMDRRKWQAVETLLDKYQIKPMVAVIPKNENEKLKIDPPDDSFWDKVKAWENKKWTIALHGYEHLYHTTEKGIVPINSRSEFAGLTFEEQEKKIIKGWEIFQEKKINSKLWIAPAHSFDANTLKALKKNTTIAYVSDGMAINPYYEYEFFWLPQQLWSFKKMPWGTWTICLHPNTMSETDLQILEEKISANTKLFTSFDQIVFKKNKTNYFDLILKMYYSLKL